MVLNEYLGILNALMQLMSMEQEWNMPLEEREEEPLFPAAEGNSYVTNNYLVKEYLGSLDSLVRESAYEKLSRRTDVFNKVQFSESKKMSTVNGTVIDRAGLMSAYGERLKENRALSLVQREGYTSDKCLAAVSMPNMGEIAVPAVSRPDYLPYMYGRGTAAFYKAAVSHVVTVQNAAVSSFIKIGDISHSFAYGSLNRELYGCYRDNMPMDGKERVGAYEILPGINTETDESLRRFLYSPNNSVFNQVEEKELAEYKNIQQYNNRYSNLLNRNFAAFSENISSEKIGEYISNSRVKSLISSSQSRETKENIVNVKVDFTANANVSSDYDVERFTAVFADKLREELSSCAEGVHLY